MNLHSAIIAGRLMPEASWKSPQRTATLGKGKEPGALPALQHGGYPADEPRISLELQALAVGEHLRAALPDGATFDGVLVCSPRAPDAAAGLRAAAPAMAMSLRRCGRAGGERQADAGSRDTGRANCRKSPGPGKAGPEAGQRGTPRRRSSAAPAAPSRGTSTPRTICRPTEEAMVRVIVFGRRLHQGRRAGTTRSGTTEQDAREVARRDRPSSWLSLPLSPRAARAVPWWSAPRHHRLELS